MLLRKFLALAILGVIPMAIACTDQSQPMPPEASSSPAISSESASSTDAGLPSVASGEAIAPGRYCYRADLPTQTAVLRLTVAANQTVTGDSRATISDEAQGYYSSYAQKISGSVAGDQLVAQIRTWIEYDVQDTDETWSITPDKVITPQMELTTAECEEVRSRFTNEDGLEASDLLDSATAVHTEQVQFEAGRNGTVINHAVIRGERDVYLLNAQGGQQMEIALTSTEQNAAFDVVSPSGEILTTEAQSETVSLPHTGDYQVIVGSTRGNATYELQITIP
ncbi:MAG: hypothetical protein HC840_27855 [Leptolyngbyaceae cyanobacterium RM2_2_4]|nr:hypothetical protein [Leptolyngbyaceae cyanobacterium SM1_4_3]NJN89208.1 hypothetical protein [Leptolyngbyaceae cyanobacterium SL_5_14]NJO52584.1 hypothetical protein [Leptolyngbyaceae cyanobacterium RM2_2_4]